MFSNKNSNNFNKSSMNNCNVCVGGTIVQNNYSEVKLVFNETKFKKMLDILDKEFNDKNIYEQDIQNSLPIRDQTEKNKRHNISEEDYINLIVNKILPYEQEMTNFFKNSRNKKCIKIYQQILHSFNVILRAYGKNFENIFCFFIEVNAKMKENYKQEIENYEEDLISLFLYYTYYFCDLDKDKVINNVSNSK